MESVRELLEALFSPLPDELSQRLARAKNEHDARVIGSEYIESIPPDKRTPQQERAKTRLHFETLRDDKNAQRHEDARENLAAENQERSKTSRRQKDWAIELAAKLDPSFSPWQKAKLIAPEMRLAVRTVYNYLKS